MSEFVICRRPHSPLFAKSDPRSEHVSEVLYGERADVISRDETWLHLRNMTDSYEGYAPAAHFDVADSPAAATHFVRVPLSHRYTAADLKSPVRGWLPMMALLSVQRTVGSWLETADGWVPRTHVQEIGAVDLDIVDVARRFGDAPYLWGGRTAMGIDCSGLVQISAAACGIKLPRDSGPQLAAMSPLKEGEKPSAGDVAGFAGHIGLMVDRNHILHANATNMAITIDPLDDVIRWVEDDLRDRQIHKPAFKGFFSLPHSW